jgi:cation diffusion facilitator CzcD-associated flavoprotein CzcO
VELPADLIVTATGLNMVPLGKVAFSLDGVAVDVSRSLTYKGIMCSDVPNLAMASGYTNASWTLKVELTCRYVCRLLNHMDEHGYAQCTPRRIDASVQEQPFIDFSSGYVQRAVDKFPRQGSKAPWRTYQNYALDFMALTLGSVRDPVMEFRTREGSARS